MAVAAEAVALGAFLTQPEALVALAVTGQSISLHGDYMAVDPVTAALDIGGKLIDRLWPDPAQRDAAKLELLRLQQSGELAEMTAQTEINKVEAASASVFVAGWRPAVGWVCVAGLFYTFLLRPLLAWASGMVDVPVPPPLDMGDLFTLLAGMLGLSASRTFEKVQGVAR